MLQLFILISLFFTVKAQADICDVFEFLECGSGSSSSVRSKGAKSRSSSGSSLPSSSSSQGINPSTVPTSKGMGIEMINFDNSQDFNLVTGNGVVGSGVSTTSNEGTFFGNVPYETIGSYQARKLDKKKYKSEKISTSFAMNLFGQGDKKKSSFWMPVLNVGYHLTRNESTHKFNSGPGASLSLGPIMGSIARFADDYRDSITRDRVKYYIQTWSLGIRTPFLSLEQVHLNSLAPNESNTILSMGNIFVGPLVLTAGERREQSIYPYYTQNTFKERGTKKEYFGAIQFELGKRIMLGVFYNYYLNKEYSFSFTAFLF